jgi:anti-anti-sigma regulatory factor
MLKITRATYGEAVFTLSGRIDEEDTAELETLIRSEAGGRRIALDLKDVTLVVRVPAAFSSARKRTG